MGILKQYHNPGDVGLSIKDVEVNGKVGQAVINSTGNIVAGPFSSAPICIADIVSKGEVVLAVVVGDRSYLI